MAVVIRFIRNMVGWLKGCNGCSHCGGKWNWKQEHIIYYTKTNGMFPLCEECYEKLSPQERYDYCIEVWNSWGRPDNEAAFDMIAKNVGLESSEQPKKEAEG